MAAVKLNDLVPGMVVSADVFDSTGHVLAETGTAITEALITKLKSYYVYTVYIDDATIPDPSARQKTAGTRSEQIKASPVFRVFKEKYDKAVTHLEDQMNDIVQRNARTINTSQLIQAPLELFESQSALTIFDILHNLRSYDDTTYVHCVNVSLISGIIARWAGRNEEDVQKAMLCGILHDIGKVNIPDTIIKKPGKLSAEEYAIVKNHTMEGYKILENYDIDPDLKYAALMHHERCDGTGYPFALKGVQINDFAKIVAIADVYDAMTSARCYRGPICPFEVIDIMMDEGLERYDTALILTFLEHMGETYLHNRVRLSDGQEGEIIFVDSRYPSRPLIEKDDKTLISLKDTKLRITEIL